MACLSIPFMGIELDVLVGHPEHELLFVAVQVAKAAGLANPSNRVCLLANKDATQAFKIDDLGGLPKLGRPDGAYDVQGRSWMFTEGLVYRMLMRGSTDKAQAFQTWLAEEVLPTIRKTGSYNAEKSTNPALDRVPT